MLQDWSTRAREYTSGFIENPLFVLKLLELAERYETNLNTKYVKLEIEYTQMMRTNMELDVVSGNSLILPTKYYN